MELHWNAASQPHQRSTAPLRWQDGEPGGAPRNPACVRLRLGCALVLRRSGGLNTEDPWSFLALIKRSCRWLLRVALRNYGEGSPGAPATSALRLRPLPQPRRGRRLFLRFGRLQVGGSHSQNTPTSLETRTEKDRATQLDKRP